MRWKRARATVYPNDGSITDIMDLDYFGTFWRLIIPPRRVYYDPNDSNISTLVRGTVSPNAWNPADCLAKSLYSTVLTDLGQNVPHPNILADPALLQPS